MADPINERNYPPTLYPPGRSPLTRKRMNHWSHLSVFRALHSEVGDAVFNDVMSNSRVGVVLKLYAADYVFCAQTVHNLLTNQLAITNDKEIWSLIGGRPIRFSLYEFSDITGLNCDPIDPQDNVDIDHKDFWRELGVQAGHGPDWKELTKAIESCRTWSYEKRRMLSLLLILHVGIFGLHRNSRIPLRYAKRVMDFDAFERYPWGRVSFDYLVSSVKLASGDSKSYMVHGCVHALLIWAFEAVPMLGETCGNRRNGVQDVPLLVWRGGRFTYKDTTSFEELIRREKVEYGKVRVRHSLRTLTVEEMFPQWINGNNDQRLFNMLEDIVLGNLDETAWET